MAIERRFGFTATALHRDSVPTADRSLALTLSGKALAAGVMEVRDSKPRTGG